MNPNDLLLWMSAKKSGTWSRYRAAVDELQLSEEPGNYDEDLGEGVPDNSSLPIHTRLRLNFERLGHAEFFRKNYKNGWSVVPPVLACGFNKVDVIGILCGARTDYLLNQLKGVADVRILETKQVDCPDRIEIIAKDEGQLVQIASSAGLYLQPNATRMLLASIPPVDDGQYRTPDELPFGEDWEVHRFSAESHGWTSATAEDARIASFGLYRFKIAYQFKYYIQLHGRAFKIPVQVGKYLVLRKERQHVVVYDENNHSFSVPISYRLPQLVDRALTLCSGLIPCIENGRLIYPNVSSSIAMTATSLLRQ